MTSAALPEGKISLRLALAGEQVSSVAIRSTRPIHASQIFQGQPIEQALTLLPLLFTVCGNAQSIAGARAIEAAQGREAPPWQNQLRKQLIAAETIGEHCWRILLDWPKLTQALTSPAGGDQTSSDGSAGKKDLLAIRQGLIAFNKALAAARLPLANNRSQAVKAEKALLAARAQQAANCQQLLAILGNRLFGRALTSWLAITNLSELTTWLEHTDTAASRLLRAINQCQWQASGQSEVPPLADFAPQQWLVLAQQMTDQAFIEQPHWRAAPAETSSCTRATSPLLTESRQRYGNGLLTRALARLTELASMACELVEPGHHRGYSASQPLAAATGLGAAHAARGLLLHRVELNGTTIRHYAVLAPTEWNFAHQGVVAQGLNNLRGSAQAIEQQARVYIESIDPCVAYDLQITPTEEPH
ncbi:nickel-dependent hydrogenase large subunit [Halioxenophilus sp. WMMB6]|uniref:nickel-dependent hydrogenase large subunit n=1 Tax=Halioxenophilus sp. WMMB6 TaxID=3073815 RepID=UPI00295ECB58|nr:nickel-dependent hydrogenase large subunit [Halioxenophilus sp. WMMB6]